jgi:hypothetical protein
VALAGLITALSLAVFSRLTGGVLSRKLPAFPMRSWLVLHVLMGCVFGMAVAPAHTIPDEVDPEPLDIETIAVLTAAGIVIGLLLGAGAGLLQALVLRKAARGLTSWIGFSALAGTMLGITFLVISLAPQTGLASDIVNEVAGFFAAVIVGLILLPAFRRLQPRETATPAPAAPPRP